MNHDFEERIRRAHAERAWYLAGLIAEGIAATMRGVSWTARGLRRAWTVPRDVQPKRRLAPN